MLQQMRSLAKWIWLLVVLAFVGVWGVGEVSGLLRGGPAAVSPSTTVAKVNGTEITYDTWVRAREAQIRQAQAQSPAPLNDDDNARIANETFDNLVQNILLQQEYRRRGIGVTDEEIQQAALQQPPPQFLQAPDFQTNGRFDIDKYRRFLSSPIAKQQGILVQLEDYYRQQIPQEKLFEEIATQVYVTDARLWRIWQDTHDSAQVSYVRLDPATIPDSAVSVSESEIAQYFQTHRSEFAKLPGRAVVTVAMIPRVITAHDTARVRAHAVALRDEILKGASFADVAKRESADSASAVRGGSLGWVTRGQFVKEFDQAAFALPVGAISEPVLSPFGFHLIKVDQRHGDSISVSHILLRIQQGDSSATVSDRLADSLSKAASAERPALFDSVTRALGLHPQRLVATEGQPLTWNGAYVPSVSAWAFGAKPGETGDLVDAPNAYYLALLDSLQLGGQATLALVHDQIRAELVRTKKLDALTPRARAVAAAVAGGKTLEEAAAAAGLSVQTTPMFARVTQVAGLGQASEAVGAAFGLPIGSVSEPVRSQDGVYVLRVDKRVTASRSAWEAQKKAQRQDVLQAMRRQAVQEYLASLRDNAKIVDNRRSIELASRAGT